MNVGPETFENLSDICQKTVSYIPFIHWILRKWLNRSDWPHLAFNYIFYNLSTVPICEHFCDFFCQRYYRSFRKMSPLVALAIALVTVSATPSQNSQDAMKSIVSHLEKINVVGDAGSQLHHRQRRAIPLLFKSGGGQKPGDISKAPPEVAAMLQMGRTRFSDEFFSWL